jgi:cytochrome P450
MSSYRKVFAYAIRRELFIHPSTDLIFLTNCRPVGLPRVVPQGGGTVSGYQLPEGTFVNVHPLTLSRSPTMFHDPDGFHPERWMPEGGPVFSSDVQNAVQAFGIGPRSCIGRLLAWAEIRLILARLLCRFNLQMAETPSGRVKWDEQRAFTVVQRKPFDIRLKLREGMQILW